MDGLSTFVATEPNSRSNGGAGAVGGSGGFGGGSGVRNGVARGRGAQAARGRQPPAPGRQGGLLTGKSLDEKVAMCCRDFNTVGCSWAQCRFMHKCSYVDKAKNRICFLDHSKLQH